MQTADFEDLYNLEESFWWFVAMRHITDTVLASDLKRPLDILDAGCGTGYNIQHYEKLGHRVFSFDVSEDALAGVRKRGERKVCQASVTHIPYASDSFDLVTSFEVLDQLELDAAAEAIRELHRVVKPGGSLYIRLPAFEWMRSSHDEDIATAHRYTRPELREMLRLAGFEIQLISYANMFLFPVVVLKRSLKKIGIGRGSDVKPLPSGLGWIDPIFRDILASEANRFGAGRSLPFGLSVMSYAKKTIPEI
jgi:SAM-dependent methyltransferase